MPTTPTDATLTEVARLVLTDHAARYPDATGEAALTLPASADAALLLSGQTPPEGVWWPADVAGQAYGVTVTRCGDGQDAGRLRVRVRPWQDVPR